MPPPPSRERFGSTIDLHSSSSSVDLLCLVLLESWSRKRLIGSVIRVTQGTSASAQSTGPLEGARPVVMALKLAVVGGGKMGEALGAGLLASSWATADQLAVVEKLAPRRAELEKAHRGLTVVAEPV